jgi:hypothetical protein
VRLAGARPEHLNLATLGVLVGAWMQPGVFVAIPGGLLGVLLTKMVTDWFGGPQVATAMGSSSSAGRSASACRCCCRPAS